MVMINKDDLAELRERNRISSAELAADLERRELEDPVFDTPVTREAPAVIYKTTDNNNNAALAAATAPAPLSDAEIVDGVGYALTEISNELRREFTARIAVLEAKVDTLLTVLAGDKSRTNKRRSNAG
jgi:hypothetical protein